MATKRTAIIDDDDKQAAFQKNKTLGGSKGMGNNGGAFMR